MKRQPEAPYFAAKFCIKADVAEFRRASAWLAENCQQLDIPESQLSRLDLCLNEVLANILAHGGDGVVSTSIGLTFDCFHLPETNKINLSIADAGVAFNPLLFINQPRPTRLFDAEPGGLGLLMLQKLTDDMHYCYDQGYNLLTLTIYWLDNE